MLGEEVFLKCLPKYGEHELLLARKDEDHYFLISRRFPRLDEKVFWLERSNLAYDRSKYSTSQFSHFSLVEDGEKTLLHGSSVEVVKLYFSDSKDPIEFYVLSPQAAQADFRKLEKLFREQEGIDGSKKGQVFIKKQKREMESELESLVGKALEIKLDSEDEAIQCRGLNSIRAIINVAKEDPDYVAAIKDVEEILIAESKDEGPRFGRQGKTLRIEHNQSLYNSMEITRDWFLENA